MGLEIVAVETGPAAAAAAAAAAAERPREQQVVEIYPLSRYYFGAKDARPWPAVCETAADRALRLKAKVGEINSWSMRCERYSPRLWLVGLLASFGAHGLRTSVHGVLLVELSGHPHVLLLQVRNSSFLLPGGRLRPAEQDIQGLNRKLSSKLSGTGSHPNEDHDWQIGECIAMWWRSDFEAPPFPYPPPNARAPKECIKLFVVRLPMSRQFVVPRNLKLLAVPLSQIHDNAQVYGSIISGVPNLLSKFSVDVVRD